MAMITVTPKELYTPEPTGGVDLETMFMALGFERTQLLDSVIAGQAKEMRDRNDQIAKLNTALNKLRAAYGGQKADKQGGAKLNNFTQADYEAIKSQWPDIDKYVKAETKSHGIPPKQVPTGNYQWSKDGGFDQATQALKTDVDNLSSNSQLDMIKLQGMINKRNQTVEMLTNLMQKFSQTNSTIIGNMR